MNATGKDAQQVRLLKSLAGNFNITSMLRRIVSIYDMDDKKRSEQLALLKLSEKQFMVLHKFCRQIHDNSWRPYTAEETALYYAVQKFHALKKSREPMDWAFQIEMLPKDEQAHTACVIWWDIIGETLSSDHAKFAFFDKWLVGFRRTQHVLSERLIQNLIRCGYPELVAQNRIDVEESEKPEEAEEIAAV